MKLCIRDRLRTLDAKCSESEGSVQERTITGKQCVRLTKECSCKEISVLVRPLRGEFSYQNGHPKELNILLRHYSHVIPEELPSGLLPDRKVENDHRFEK